MDTISEFQNKYPLSPRKFWKKMLGVLMPMIVPVIVIVIALAIPLATDFIVGFQQPYNQNLTPPSTGLNAIIGFLIIGLIFLVLIFTAYCILYGLYIRAYIRRYYYNCGDQFITIKKGVFAPAEIHVIYQKIQDVYVDQDILDRIMGLYDVHIASATMTSGIEAHIDGVNKQNAEAIKDFLLGKVSNNPAAPMQAAPAQNQPLQNQKPADFKLDKKISSETYPISEKWMISVAISSFFVSLVGPIFLIAFVAQLSKLSIFFSAGSLLLFFIAAFLIIDFLLMISNIIWKKNYYFEFLPDYILLRTGILSRQEKHLPYKSIQNVTVRQSFFERMFGIASVSIENAAQGFVTGRNTSALRMGSGILVVGQPLDKANELNEVINKITTSQSNPSSMGL